MLRSRIRSLHKLRSMCNASARAALRYCSPQYQERCPSMNFLRYHFKIKQCPLKKTSIAGAAGGWGQCCPLSITLSSTQGSSEKCKCNLRMCCRATQLQLVPRVTLHKDVTRNTETHIEKISAETRTGCKVRLLGSEKQPTWIPKMTKRASLFRMQLTFVRASGKLN